MSLAASGNTWLRRYHGAHDGAPTIVTMPHAGGSANYFYGLSELLTPDAQVASVQYPGRQDRWPESACNDIGALADHVAEAVSAAVGEPFCLFGHSMGAILAFEVAVRLGRHAGPDAMIVSGARAPVRPLPEVYPLKGDEEVLREVRLLGGVDPQVLADSEIRQLVMPALRADFHAIGHYAYRPGDLVACPVTALTGDTDPRVSEADIAAWAQVTSGAFEYRLFPGGHFYLQAHLPSVARLIKAKLAPDPR